MQPEKELTESQVEKMQLEQKMEQQKIKNLKSKLKKKKQEVLWGKKKTMAKQVELDAVEERREKKGHTREQEQMRSLTRGLGKLKKKMRNQEEVSEQSSEEPILVRVTSKAPEQTENAVQRGPVRVSGEMGSRGHEEPMPRFYIDEEPILKTAKKFGKNDVISVKSKISESKVSESKRDVEVISVGGDRGE